MKVQHWSGFSDENAREAAPVLEYVTTKQRFISVFRHSGAVTKSRRDDGPLAVPKNNYRVERL